MDHNKKYMEWINSDFIDPETKNELISIKGNEKEIAERFSKDINFGTAGLRGIMGAGTNRMNIYTISLVTEALSNLIEIEGEEAKNKGVAIAYDTRYKSKEFAEITATILASHSINVYIYKEVQPTPLLSYTVRYLKTIAGVMITASHNPKEYNGYKLYWSEGSQILDDTAIKIQNEIKKIKDFSNIKKINFKDGIEKGIIKFISEDVCNSYIENILKLSLNDSNINKDINIVYTPLNGVGNKLVQTILQKRGFNNVHIVKEQELPDPEFTTVGYPNPEFKNVFKYAEKLGEKVGANILIATDPDSDRMAIEVKDLNDNYIHLNGNKIGALLIYYILESMNKTQSIPENSVIVKSVVTGDLGKSIASKYGVDTVETLTGFKNICSKANEFERTKTNKFLFGYEESIGYVYEDFVRDKDGINATMMIAEMAAYYSEKNMSLLDVLDIIYLETGYIVDVVKSYDLEGLTGQNEILNIMENFRNNPLTSIACIKVDKIIDFNIENKDFPKTNLLKFFLDGESWVAIRPSGTEPKIKIYICTKGTSMDESSKLSNEIIKEMELIMFKKISK